jgi:hypothetical protein
MLRLSFAPVLILAASVFAQQPQGPQSTTRPAKTPAQLETELSELLTGATLDGSFTSTGPRSDPRRLMSDKYTLGTVKKLEGNEWLIQARIQYGGRNVVVPLQLPIQWAGDTPVIVVDDLTIPGLGTFSARVMFFEKHYSGYWKHGERGGHLFGVIRRAGEVDPTTQATRPATQPVSRE